jgi:hypothetical protein
MPTDRLTRRRFSFVLCFFLSAVTCATCFRSTRSANLLDFVLGKRLDANKSIARSTHPDQFIKLRLNGRSITVLGVLNDEDHQKRNDGSARVDNELPRVGEVKQRTAECPCRDNQLER